MPHVELSRRDLGRVLSAVQYRQRKLANGVAKFGADFDPDQGKNMVEGLEAFTRISQVLTEAMQHEDDHPRQPPAHCDEREGRRI